jgi:hypothetical protein
VGFEADDVQLDLEQATSELHRIVAIAVQDEH